MRVYLDSLGCRLNEAELASWRLGFREAGHGIALSVEDADVAVFNSCAVTQDASRTSRKNTRRLHRMNPEAKIVLTGCYASLEPEQASALEGVDLLVSNQDKDSLVQRVLSELPSWEMPARAVASVDEEEADVGERSRAFVKVQDGCRHKCTYCIVTRARGEERSRTMEDIAEEINRHHAAGHAEAVLTGVHLGGYGNDLGVELTDLIELLLDQTRIPRIRIGSLEPWRLDERFFALWGKSERLMPHLHLPLQSGSDTVLKRMGRRCNQRDYESLVRLARESIPGLHLSTDLIVGFPGETEQEFEEGLAFSERMGFEFGARVGDGDEATAVLARQIPEIGAQQFRLHRRARLGGNDEQRVLGVDRRRHCGDLLRIGGIEHMDHRAAAPRPHDLGQDLRAEARPAHAEEHRGPILGCLSAESFQCFGVDLLALTCGKPPEPLGFLAAGP